MPTQPPESPQPAGSSEAWRRLLTQLGHTSDGPLSHQSPEPALGESPTARALTEKIDNARRQFSTFTSQATTLVTSINDNEAVTDEQVGSALDQAGAWVEYFGPHGPLCAGFPASTPSDVYVGARARVGQLQRQAQQWVDYFRPLWEKRSSFKQDLARAEEECLQRVAQAEQRVTQREVSFATNSSSMSSEQMQGFIQELNDFRATVSCWLVEAKGASCRQRLQRLIEKIDWVLGEFNHFLDSKRKFEWSQRRRYGWRF